MSWDIHFQPVPEDNVRGRRAFTFGFWAAVRVTGFQFLINRWLKTFFTPQGSDLMDPDAGTILADQIGGNIGSLETAEGLAVQSVEDTNDQVRRQDEDGGHPENESLENAYITDMLPRGSDGLEIWVMISNKAGEKIKVRLTELATR